MKAAVSKAVALTRVSVRRLCKKVVDYFFSYLTVKNPCVEVFKEGGTSHTGTQVIKA